MKLSLNIQHTKQSVSADRFSIVECGRNWAGDLYILPEDQAPLDEIMKSM